MRNIKNDHSVVKQRICNIYKLEKIWWCFDLKNETQMFETVYLRKYNTMKEERIEI